MALSIAELYATAVGAGFPAAEARTMAAVALGESSGNPRAYNGTGADRSYGLWQINMIGALGPARLQEFGISSADALFDPATNARAAYTIWAGNDANITRNWGATGAASFGANVAAVDAALGPAGGLMDSLSAMFPPVAAPSLPAVDWSGLGGSISEAVSSHVAEIALGAVGLGLLWLAVSVAD